MKPLHSLSATEALSNLVTGRISSEALVLACLQQIARHEPQIRAWQHLDAQAALHACRASDAMRASGGSIGKLHGLPVAIKDNMDTADMPTTYGSPLYAGHLPVRDAAVVSMLRAEGAIILGKTVSTEFAYFTPGPTHNPHRPGYTPGGSSSGSAAAVAAGMVPLALGTQTNGSVIRPAAFCGVLGYKPAAGLIARDGVLDTSHTLDQVGCFARTVDDLELLAHCLAPTLTDRSVETTARLRIAILNSELLSHAEDGTRALLQRTSEQLANAGLSVSQIDLGPWHAYANQAHRTIMQSEMAQALAPERVRGETQLSPALLELMNAGDNTSAVAYLDALRARGPLQERMDQLLASHDVMLMPSAPGAAPEGLGSTGSPLFCSMISLLGWPAMHLPTSEDAQGLPLGLQLVARPGDEAKLGTAARQIMQLAGRPDGAPLAAGMA
ncbi:amidase [Ottowia thiooxydans]|uniref:Asp-tRNA(Asn)/Glu-tRNA(Gln) amidotransferase A subunit family amidase n=1 Tax=Ottowia thiooxydans TaxID=219182 RepID=A0ABV2QCW2_9BURK